MGREERERGLMVIWMRKEKGLWILMAPIHKHMLIVLQLSKIQVVVYTEGALSYGDPKTQDWN
ncbi:hypothetical protein HanPI659440_Chr14g0554101 [Helianthus annuus]|nr:hypothetical protein HanPI659440_Chr14g0554101 [Helianthus annuus]